MVGYCLGAYKAANLTKWIASKQPALLAKVDVAIFGVGVVTAPGLRHLYQEGGNLDTFGRINSTLILADDLVPGRYILASLAQGKSAADVKADQKVLELRTRIDAYVATALRIDSERTPSSDLYEYTVYKERLAAAAAAAQDAGSD